MKAIIIDKTRTPNSLELRDVEKPTPAANEVLIKIVAVSINAADYRSIRMGIAAKNKIYGADVAGHVESVGKDVKRFKVGDDVFGDLASCGFGGFAEYVAAPETLLALKPTEVSYQIASAIPMASVTALQALRNEGKLQAGQNVLIYGAGGGVGNFASQLAKYFGARVTAVCGPRNVDLVKSLGVDQVLDYTLTDALTTEAKYDLIIAVNGTRSVSEYKRALTSNGTCVVVGGGLDQVIKALLFKGVLSIGGKKVRVLAAKASAKDLEFVIQLVKDGKIKVIIDRQYRLEQTPEAIEYMSTGHALGKVVISQQ